MRHRWRVYLKLFDDNGDYQSDWLEITDDVDMDSIGSISKDLDNTEYDVGVYRASNFKMKLRNTAGRFSDIGSPNTIFSYKRSNTLVKVTWEHTDETAICGIALADECWTSEEITVFTGLLNDEASEIELASQSISFTVLGRESIFQKCVVPYSSISAGQSLNTVLYTILNQSDITAVMTIDSGNISVGLNQTLDVVTNLENKTVQEALSELLLMGNAVMYLDGDSLIISARTATASVIKTFYGQGSSQGSENIQDVKKLKSGIARTFNFWTWQDTALYSEDASSRALYLTRKKEIGSDSFTDTSKRTSILNSLRDEFGLPKQEMDLYTPLNYETMDLELLDRIAIDYPVVYAEQLNELPVCGSAVLGAAVLPNVIYDFSITTETNFKILGKSIDVKSGIVKLKIRQV